MKTLSAPMGMAEVAMMLGWTRRRTVRLLETIDAEVGGMLLTKRGTGSGRRYTVTKAALRRVMPDWFESVENLSSRVDALEDAQKTEIVRLNVVSAHVGTLTRDVSRLKIKRPQASTGNRQSA